MHKNRIIQSSLKGIDHFLYNYLFQHSMLLKSIPEDFIVEEITPLHFDDKGTYSYYTLKKINTDHNTALQIIADTLKINRKYINVAGIKDKRAITMQYLSISQGQKMDIKKENVGLTFLGTGKERIHLGQLEGNNFTIIVRNITPEEMKNFEKNKQNLRIPNYYDNQRFGAYKDNAVIGKFFLRRQWKKAGNILKERETSIRCYLQAHATDFIGALRTLSKQQLRMYLHACQSYLWNETVKELIKENVKLKNEKIPLIGFEIECDDKQILHIIEKIMKQEGIKERDFIIREIPELSSSGGGRMLFMDIKNFSYEIIDSKTITLQFTLGKGSYATIVMKALFL